MRAMVVLVLVLAASGCLAQPVDSSRSSPQAVEHRTIAQGQQSGLTDPARVVIDDAPTWEALWENHTRGQIPPDPKPSVDLARERIVAVFAGSKPNGCWSIQPGNVTSLGAVTTIEVVVREPAPGQPCTTSESQPFFVLGLPRTRDTIAFDERTLRGSIPSS